MQPEAAGLLWDARKAAGLIADFVGNRTWQDYESDPMLRSAVEWRFQIIGDALNKLSRLDPAIAAEISDLPRIIAFRNVLVHGYAVIDEELVWEVSTRRAPDLAAQLRDYCPATTANDASAGSRSTANAGRRDAPPGPFLGDQPGTNDD